MPEGSNTTVHTTYFNVVRSNEAAAYKAAIADEQKLLKLQGKRNAAATAAAKKVQKESADFIKSSASRVSALDREIKKINEGVGRDNRKLNESARRWKIAPLVREREELRKVIAAREADTAASLKGLEMQRQKRLDKLQTVAADRETHRQQALHHANSVAWHRTERAQDAERLAALGQEQLARERLNRAIATGRAMSWSAAQAEARRRLASPMTIIGAQHARISARDSAAVFQKGGEVGQRNGGTFLAGGAARQHGGGRFDTTSNPLKTFAGALVANSAIFSAALPVLSGILVHRAIASLGELVTQVDKLGKESRSLNVSAKAWAEWQVVAEKAGGEAGQLGAAMRQLASKTETAVHRGSGKMIDIYNEMGVALKDAEGNARSLESVMTDIFSSLARMDEDERTFYAAKLFPEKMGLIVNMAEMGASAMQKWREETVLYGRSFEDEGVFGRAEEFSDEWGRFWDLMLGGLRRFGIESAVSLNLKGMNDLSAWEGKIKQVFPQNDKLTAEMAKYFTTYYDGEFLGPGHRTGRGVQKPSTEEMLGMLRSGDAVGLDPYGEWFRKHMPAIRAGMNYPGPLDEPGSPILRRNRDADSFIESEEQRLREEQLAKLHPEVALENAKKALLAARQIENEKERNKAITKALEDEAAATKRLAEARAELAATYGFIRARTGDDFLRDQGGTIPPGPLQDAWDYWVAQKEGRGMTVATAMNLNDMMSPEYRARQSEREWLRGRGELGSILDETTDWEGYGGSELEREFEKMRKKAERESAREAVKEQKEWNRLLKEGRSFADGFAKGLNDVGESAEESAKRGRQAYEGLEQAITTTLARAVQDGKFSLDTLKSYFLQFALDIAGDFLTKQLLGAGASLLGGFGSTPTQFGLTTPNPHTRALGGPVGAGQPYLVGEKGPELFMPNQNGHVFTTAQTAGMMRGGGGTRIFNVTVAMDPRASETKKREAVRIAMAGAALAEARQSQRRDFGI